MTVALQQQFIGCLLLLSTTTTTTKTTTILQNLEKQIELNVHQKWKLSTTLQHRYFEIILKSSGGGFWAPEVRGLLLPLLLEFNPTSALVTMRIVHFIRALIAVLGFAAVFHPVTTQHLNETFTHHESRPRRKHHHPHEEWYDYKHEIALRSPGKFLTQRENQMLLRQEIKNRTGVDCCPSVLEMIEPDGGKNQDDEYVELYRDGDYSQRFYELSCHSDILGKPCRFMDRKLHEHSRCVQKYSYTYAIVKDLGRHHNQRPKNFPSFPSGPDGKTTWTLDYIRVRSGCGCVVTPNFKKKRDRPKHKRIKNEDLE